MTDQVDYLQRCQMVKEQIEARGVQDSRVLEAMRRVPREEFVPGNLRKHAFEDCPLPIDAGQTISQPYIVAFMVEALNLGGGERVLDIGTGSGYAAAVLAELAERVYSIERISKLASKAKSKLESLHYQNVEVRVGDGTQGWQEKAPFDAIVVAAAGIEVPESLKNQLKIGGRLVIPVEDRENSQRLIRLTRNSETEFRQEILANVAFVPLISD